MSARHPLQKKHRHLAGEGGPVHANADFDRAPPTRIDRAAVESALKIEFIVSRRNLVLGAPQGLGKATFAQNIAHQAVLKVHTALYTTARSSCSTSARRTRRVPWIGRRIQKGRSRKSSEANLVIDRDSPCAVHGPAFCRSQ